MQKTLNYSIHSSKRHRQYESNKVNNTATKHSLVQIENRANRNLPKRNASYL